jgi:hypothetical protein
LKHSDLQEVAVTPPMFSVMQMVPLGHGLVASHGWVQ